MIMRVLCLLLLLLALCSCEINVDNPAIPKINTPPVTATFTASSFNEDTQQLITLTYADVELDEATSCKISSLVGVSQTQSCNCINGTCRVGVTGLLNYNGAASFVYEVSDADDSNQSLVSLSILPVNDAPVVDNQPLSISMNRNEAESGTFSASDVESDPLNFLLVTGASNGTVIVNADGTFTYTPNASYSGVDSFEIKANDGLMDSASVIVLVTVNSTIVCPANYTLIPANTTLGTDSFCVMTFSAKDLSDGNAYSQAAGVPWGSINATAAQAACRGNGAGYDLISNREWLAISYLIESRPENWSTGVVGSGVLNRGHTDSSAGVLSVSNTSDPYDQTGNSTISGWEQRRTFYISATEFLWDFSGNSWSWVDWTTGGAFDQGPRTCLSEVWYEIYDVSSNCSGINSLDYMPLNPGGVNPLIYGSSYNLGNIYGTGTASRGYTIRGGDYYDGSNAGIYSIYWALNSTDTGGNIGFRCVYR